ncbi:MAG: class I SAM-dependent rRNA methyltransferase [Planctomycetota bacterium]
MTPSGDQRGGSAKAGPWVKLRSAKFHTFIYRRMVDEASPDAVAGNCVTVFDRHREVFGHGLYNPRSQIAIRMLNFDAAPVDTAFWQRSIERAVGLRMQTLRLGETTEAYRLVHAEGDGLSGLIVDRYGDVLAVEVTSLGIWRLIGELLPMLHAAAGTRHHSVNVDERVQRQEGFVAKPIRSDGMPTSVKIVENGVRFEVRFDARHKTGFFCDQRDNRQRMARLAKGAEVLDVCCFSGGFGVAAKAIGDAKAVTCVDIDEDAVDLARHNANLNQTRVETTQADAFAYMRQMQVNGRQYDLVVLDPPKLIFGRNDLGEGRGKYFDLNRLAASLVRPGGVLLTCSCSGAMERDDFVGLTTGAARQAGRECQILDITGAGPDHPVSPRCPESAYLKCVWLRMC